MTDSMNFGPEWLRNLSSEGTTTGISGGGSRCQLADYRYGREEMLALFEKSFPPPASLTTFPPLYSEQVLPPLALVPATEEERQWAARGPPLGPSVRGGRGAQGVGERGGRIARGGRGAYQPYGRTIGSGGYDGGSAGWGSTGEQTEWSPRKDFTYNRSTSSGGIDNWRRSNRTSTEEEDGWRTSSSHGRGGGPGDKWSRSSSWREGDDEPREKRWHEPTSGGASRGVGNHRRGWDSQDEHLPEWATENLAEGGGTFDSSGAFHGSDEENDRDKGKELQKSASQQNIRNQHAPLVTSKSAVSLSINKTTSKGDIKEEKKPSEQEEELNKENKMKSEKEHKKESQEHQVHQKPINNEEIQTATSPLKPLNTANATNNAKTNQSNNANPPAEASGRVVEEDFEKLQEDFVSKLVVDEEPPKSVNLSSVNVNLPNAGVGVGLSNGIPAPPNIMPPAPLQEKWYYQDPQGDLQGPFLSSVMAEWYKAGYFSNALLVRRQCDERFYTLGELENLCNGNPFLSTVPIAPLKQDKLNDPDMALHYQQQFLQAQLLRSRAYNQEPTPPWNNLPRDLFPQTMIPPDMIPPANPANPLLHHMLNQFKMQPPQQPVLEEPNPMQLDPLRALVQQMGGLQSLQPRLPQQTPLKHEPTLPTMPSMHMPVNGTVPAPNTGSMLPPKDLNPSSSKIDSDFMQFMQQHAAMNKLPQATQHEQRIDLESLWKHNQSQFQQQQHQPVSNTNNIQATPQWTQSDKPISMWDTNTVQSVQGLQQVLTGNLTPTVPQALNQVPETPISDVVDKKNKKEEKKQKELEDKLAKKEAEEKRKQEQRKLELEKKQQEDKRRKEEERIKKELEKARREAEEKRLKELAEKKRLKEQRKEEEARKKAAEELKKQEDEKERLAAKDREEQKRQAELQRQLAQTIANQKPAKAAPWSQATNNQGLTLAEIQKLERERKTAEQIILQQQQLQQRQLQQTIEQTSPEKVNNAIGVQLNWANKPMKPNHVKSLAEIQAEEQDRMVKQKEKEKAAMKEKETLSPPTSTIWSGQSLTWNNSDSAAFWDDPPMPPQPQPQKKQQQLQKQNVNKQQQQLQQQQQQQMKKQAAKQKEQHANNNANLNSSSEINSSDEFTNWCTKTLANLNTQVDIPTFVSFLRDIESALDVRDYIREYLGDKPATQQFAAQFLDKRRSFKPKQQVHKDDMCSPAPAITPSSQHNNDFQEVKGKGKKCKKSKMLKVDARILGFNVTAAQDRINVGDRDYGES